VTYPVTALAAIRSRRRRSTLLSARTRHRRQLIPILTPLVRGSQPAAAQAVDQYSRAHSSLFEPPLLLRPMGHSATTPIAGSPDDPSRIASSQNLYIPPGFDAGADKPVSVT
jgi:hypothetical protein